MEIRVKGEFPMTDIRQAIFEKLNELEDAHAIRFSRGATLFINPTDGKGHDVVPRQPGGGVLRKIFMNGPYRGAFDDYKR
jgi:hypothetical protein